MICVKIQKSERGQGLVEYGTIIVLVGIVVLAVLMILAPTIGNIFTEISSELRDVSYILKII